MTYTGEVRPGGPSALRALDELAIRKASVGPYDNNTYLLTCRGSGAQLLVDAPAEPDRLLALVREGSPTARLETIVVTHSHGDHHGALSSLVAVTGAAVAAGVEDAEAITEATDRRVTRALRHGEALTFGHVVLEVVGLRGHTPGSIALVYREPEHATGEDAAPGRAHVFTGDSLFPGGVGNTDRDPARFAMLFADVTARLFEKLGDDTWIYPGHGRDTTLGAERPHLPAWRARGW